MSQSKKMSLVESCVNIAIGYCVAVVTQMIVFPALGYQVSMHDNILIGIIFTIVSLIRSYCLRRIFNRIKSP